MEYSDMKYGVQRTVIKNEAESMINTPYAMCKPVYQI